MLINLHKLPDTVDSYKLSIQNQPYHDFFEIGPVNAVEALKVIRNFMDETDNIDVRSR